MHSWHRKYQFYVLGEKTSGISPFINFRMCFIGKFLLTAGSGSCKPKCENEDGYGRGELRGENSLYVLFI